ncbi:MAG: hypothetical protein ACP5OM_05005 [Methanothrix sp.]
MSRQLIYFAGVLLLMMTAVLAVSAQDNSLNATALNNTTLNNTTLNNTTINLSVNQTINVSANETVELQNETALLPVQTSPLNDTVAVENETIPAMINATPAVNETVAATVETAQTIVPATSMLGKMETEQAQPIMLGLTAKPTFVVGSGLTSSEGAQVGSTKARTTFPLGSVAKSMITL